MEDKKKDLLGKKKKKLDLEAFLKEAEFQSNKKKKEESEDLEVTPKNKKIE